MQEFEDESFSFKRNKAITSSQNLFLVYISSLLIRNLNLHHVCSVAL
jgi:hypothetical protein